MYWSVRPAGHSLSSRHRAVVYLLPLRSQTRGLRVYGWSHKRRVQQTKHERACRICTRQHFCTRVALHLRYQGLPGSPIPSESALIEIHTQTHTHSRAPPGAGPEHAHRCRGGVGGGRRNQRQRPVGGGVGGGGAPGSGCPLHPDLLSPQTRPTAILSRQQRQQQGRRHGHRR